MGTRQKSGTSGEQRRAGLGRHRRAGAAQRLGDCQQYTHKHGAPVHVQTCARAHVHAWTHAICTYAHVDAFMHLHRVFPRLSNSRL